MNRKILFAAFTVFNLVAISLLTAIPVHAIDYIGSTTTWDYGGEYAANNATVGYSTGTGIMWATAGPGYGNANAFMNSAFVDATSDNINTIVVRVWFTTDSYYLIVGDGEITFECRLYENSQYRGTKEATFSTWYTYYFEEFTFGGLDVDTGDDLDVDVKFIVYANEGQAGIFADFTYVSFYIP